MKMTVKLASLLILLAGIVAVRPAIAAEAKIATVSLQRALNEVEEGKRAKAAIQADMDVKKKQLESMKTDLKKMRDDLEKQKAVLAKDALETKANEMQAKFMDLQQKAVQYEEELKKKESESVQKILLSLRTMVQDMSKQGQYTLVFENSSDSILYAQGVPDLTDELIRKYNATPKK